MFSLKTQKGSNRLNGERSESNGLMDESFLDQASKSLLSNDALSKSNAKETSDDLPLRNTGRKKNSGENLFNLPPRNNDQRLYNYLHRYTKQFL